MGRNKDAFMGLRVPGALKAELERAAEKLGRMPSELAREGLMAWAELDPVVHHWLAILGAKHGASKGRVLEGLAVMALARLQADGIEPGVHPRPDWLDARPAGDRLESMLAVFIEANRAESEMAAGEDLED